MLSEFWNVIRDAIAVVDDGGRIVDVNQAWRDVGARNGLQYPNGALHQNYLEICDCVRGEDEAVAREAAAGLRRVLSGAAAAFEMEFPCHSPSERRWWRLRATRFQEQGRILAALTHEDITERRAVETALRESETMLREAQRIAGLGSYDLDVATGIWKSSKVLDEVFGIGPEYVRTVEGWAALIHPGDRAAVAAYFQNDVLGERRDFDRTYRIVRQNDGALRYVHGMGKLIPDDQGRVRKMFGTIQDITARTRADLERERSIELLRRINTSASTGQLAAEVVPLLRQWMECEAVGIRFAAGGDFPYLASSGFSPEFLQAEERLCAGGCARDGRPNLTCLCGCVLRKDAGKGVLTERGSFWSQDARELAARTPDWKSWTRGRCLAEGYRSLALIPLRLGTETLGLMQLNDRRPGRFTAEQIVFLEHLADNLSVALAELRSQELLRQSEEKYRLITESVRDVVWTIDAETLQVLYVSPSVTRLRGFTPEEVMAQPIEGGLMPQAVAYVKGIIARAVADYLSGREPPDKAYIQEVEQPCKDGSTVFTEVVATIHRHERTGRLEIRGVSRDIRERKQAEAQIELLKHSIDVHFDGAYWFDTANRLVYVNEAGCRALGYSREELLGRPLSAINRGVTEIGLQDVWERLRKTGRYVKETVHTRQDGTEFPVEISSTYVQFGGQEYNCGFARDISERKRAEEEIARHRASVAHLARLNVMGQMATGLAHELNQPLTAIRNYTHYCKTILQNGMDLDLKLPDALDRVDSAAVRASQIIERMREFVRKQVPERTSTDINGLLRKCLGLMEPVCQRLRIRVERHFASRLPPALLDQVQIEQVLVNLIQNAIDAMADTPTASRLLVLRTAAVDGPAVQVEVMDHGSGIAPADAPRIFEEFFTTKKTGTGLGLSISKSIVDSHGGRLAARPNPEGGAILEMILPLQKEA